MNSLVKTLLGICLMAVCWLPVSAQSGSVRGDVNGDAVVSIVDVTYLINYLLSPDEGSINHSAADLDGDGNISIADVTTLIKYLLTGEWNIAYEPVYETITVSGVEFRMLLVKGGTFMMGAPSSDSNAEADEKPQHQVTVSSFAIGQTEVTQELWTAVMGSNPSLYDENNKFPVHSITFLKTKNKSNISNLSSFYHSDSF